jgi:hypothetical protein
MEHLTKILIAMSLTILIIIGSLFLLSYISFLYVHGYEKFVIAEKLNEKPENYMNISDQQMTVFPHLKEAINNSGEYVSIPEEEWRQLKNLLESQNTMFIEYQSEYYDITFKQP